MKSLYLNINYNMDLWDSIFILASIFCDVYGASMWGGKCIYVYTYIYVYCTYNIYTFTEIYMKALK